MCFQLASVVEACELDCRKVVVPSSVEVSPTVTFSVELCDLLDVPATVVVCRSVVESMWLVVCILLLLSTAECFLPYDGSRSSGLLHC